MKKHVFRVDSDGYNGAWYPASAESKNGAILMLGDSAEDDVLWDTCKYIRRMEGRLAELPHDSTFESWLYKNGTHFAFPESLLKMMLPVGSGLLVSFMFKAGKEHKKECRKTRIDIDRRMNGKGEFQS